MSRPASPRTWVRPNRNTIGLVAVLLGMGYAGLTQNNGAAYLLCFVLASASLVSTVHAWANLRGLRVAAHVLRPAFAGERLTVNVRVSSSRQRIHCGIHLLPARGGSGARFPEIPANAPADGELLVPAVRRGIFDSLVLKIESRYPLGFFTARTTLILAAPHSIYPTPSGDRSLPVSLAVAQTAGGGPRIEGDDFAGVRAWRTGESQRHIDWKAVARGQPLVIKEWTGEPDTTLTFDWETLADLPHERRLEQLARWIVDAEHSGQAYALYLPGERIPAGRGDAHYHTCLRRLAAFPREGAA